MSPKHSIDYCPICGGGLCGIRICGLSHSEQRDATHERRDAATHDAASANVPDEPHGLIVCDECEAIWLEPDTSTDHVYPSAECSACPVCLEPLWGAQSRWATRADVQRLGWSSAVNSALDAGSDEEFI